MLLCSVLALFCALVSSAVDRQYLNEWAVEIPGGYDNARSIADELGYKLVRQVSHANTVFLFLHIVKNTCLTHIWLCFASVLNEIVF